MSTQTETSDGEAILKSIINHPDMPRAEAKALNSHVATLTAERDAALARVSELERTGRDMATGIGVHNDRTIDRHMPIEGAVVSAFLAALTKDQSNG